MVMVCCRDTPNQAEGSRNFVSFSVEMQQMSQTQTQTHALLAGPPLHPAAPIVAYDAKLHGTDAAGSEGSAGGADAGGGLPGPLRGVPHGSEQGLVARLLVRLAPPPAALGSLASTSWAVTWAAR
eukprot:TRINITY_DN13050_c0_g3_i1.p2 TRINITY_DN13050_c0_g3~~TRINITY_DN13050_c0_g3_i1.p2  ORF type:complete len:137 (+),score=14.90 TRINITY_DN13050_c0_g3_i1:37-411(+)